jgi:hypothetical protein
MDVRRAAGLLLLRHITPLTRRNVVYFYSGAHNCQTGVAVRTFPTIFAYAKGGNLTVTTAGQLPSLSTTGLGV